MALASVMTSLEPHFGHLLVRFISLRIWSPNGCNSAASDCQLTHCQPNADHSISAF